jgi:membrane protein YdbS with pleckstrin-like domain
VTQIAHGIAHRLDPRVIRYGLVVGRVTAAVLAGASLVGLLIALAAVEAPALVWLAAGPAWLAVVVVLVGWFERWPALSYRYSSFLLDDQAIEIRIGVYWRQVIAVPRSRVQHIDVTQGPLQRSYELATLTIFTAGTAHSSVAIAGLSHATALALRDALLPKRTVDGV